MNLAQHFQAATSTGLENDVVVMGDASLEAAVADIVEAGQEVTEANRVANEMQDVADSLESYREALTLTQESGNIDQTTASWMLAAGDAITSRVGVSLQSVSVESFGSPSDAADAVELVSLEAGGLWEKLVQAIKDMIAKARNALKGLWVKLTDGGAKLAKRGEALAKKAKDTKGSSEENSFDASFGSKIHINGSAPKGSDLVKAVSNLDSYAAKVFKESESSVKSIADEYKTLLTAAAEGKDFNASTFIGKMAALPAKYSLTIQGPDHLSVAEGNVMSSDELLGGRVIYASYPNVSTENAGKAVQQFRLGMGSKKEKIDVDSNMEVEVLSTSNCITLGNTIKLIGDRLTGFNSNFKARDKMKDQLNKELEKIEKKASKGEKDMDAAEKQASRDAIQAARAVVEALDNPVSDYARYLVTTLSTVVAWGEKSLSMYKES